MDEYIGKDQVIEWFRPYGHVDEGIPYYGLVTDIREMKTADVAPVVHWVLTDEKLPPNGQDVLCWYEYFRFGEYNRMYQTFGIGYQFNGNWGGEVVQGQKAKVLAWIPLPKPPKLEGGESGETD